jgi:hypothetical protein
MSGENIGKYTEEVLCQIESLRRKGRTYEAIINELGLTVKPASLQLQLKRTGQLERMRAAIGEAGLKKGLRW